MEPINIGNRKQLFVDDALIEKSSALELTMNPPHRTSNPLIQKDRPWEQGGPSSGIWRMNSCVLPENDTIRLWYESMGDDYRHTCYAESTDGVNFTKPELGLVEVDGSKDNNIVQSGPIGGGTIWMDPHAPDEERYRTLRKTRPGGQLGLYSSPDGLRWETTRMYTIGSCDTQSVAFWDPAYDSYVLYTRLWIDSNDRRERYRTHRRLTSEDLSKWVDDRVVLEADGDDLLAPIKTNRPAMDYYGGGVFKYPDQNGIYFMLAQAYWHWQRWEEGKRSDQPATTDVRLFASRDGRHFSRPGGKRPFMRLGPAGQFDSMAVWAMPNPVITDDEVWIYYAGSNKDHDHNIDPATPSGEHIGAISRVVMRLDGFVSADASYTGGEILTVPLRFEGDKLILNLDTSGGGWCVVEILDPEGNPIEGFSGPDAVPLVGNSVRMPVTWQNERQLSPLANKPVRLRFRMRDCKLYAFKFV
ncbi:MAG: hypothetical protein ACLFWL_10155 [Candidatus Brocadiia bacterium]